jgi:hypothetical protein
VTADLLHRIRWANVARAAAILLALALAIAWPRLRAHDDPLPPAVAAPPLRGQAVIKEEETKPDAVEDQPRAKATKPQPVRASVPAPAKHRAAAHQRAKKKVHRRRRRPAQRRRRTGKPTAPAPTAQPVVPTATAAPAPAGAEFRP